LMAFRARVFVGNPPEAINTSKRVVLADTFILIMPQR
jgi:hypothetical protein